MKTIISLTMLIFTFGTMSAQQAGIRPILEKYLQIKEALVADEAPAASAAANEFNDVVRTTQVDELQPKEAKSFTVLKSSLLKFGETIYYTLDIDEQREAFANLSVKMWELVETAESIVQIVYYQYCQMKKAYWLSTEKAIENPYYGAGMLTCGIISDTKNKN